MTNNIEFNLSKEAFVTDPCYERGTSCAGTVKTRPGKWFANVIQEDKGAWGVRNSKLICWHSEFTDNDALMANKMLPFVVGVDSGQAGVFCEEAYPKGNETGDYDDPDSFYRQACDASYDEQNPEKIFGALPNGKGVCASSGYGDGCYEAYGHFVNEECVAISIVFIGEDEEVED